MAPLAAGETGLLLVNGPSRMLGYLGEPERTAQALVDGYYSTGDLACVDSDGFLHIVDRLARFSKIAGEMVPHLKIEETVHEILGDQPCVVLGIPDDQRGERLALLYTETETAPTEVWQRLSETGFAETLDSEARKHLPGGRHPHARHRQARPARRESHSHRARRRLTFERSGNGEDQCELNAFVP